MSGWVRSRPALATVLILMLAVVAVWGVKFAKVVRSVEANAAYWAQPRGEAGGLLYVALGDSAAQGIGASDPEHGYVSLLAEQLRNASGRPVQVINLSRSGARIGDVLDTQIDAVRAIGRKPDVMTVAIGGNDIRAFDRATFASQVQRLTAALPQGTYIADAPYFMHGRWERDSQQAAELLTASAIERGLRPVALHQELRKQGLKAMLTQFAADWFHPNDRGHRVWADAFWREIEADIPP